MYNNLIQPEIYVEFYTDLAKQPNLISQIWISFRLAPEVGYK